MKNVRIFYTKTGRMKFVSHLDMNRLMPRLIKRSGLPVWYTEGFNRHIYINYAVPLSLGFEGEYEVMDIRLTDDGYSLTEVTDRLKAVTVDGIKFIRAAEPLLATKDIAFAEYEIKFEKKLPDGAEKFFEKEEILCRKTAKKGKIKEINIMPLIKSFSIDADTLSLILPAGNENNLNPSLVVSAFFENTGCPSVFYAVRRKMLFDREMNRFV